MEQLLSGLIGALAATVLSVVYHWNSENRTLRRELLVDVVAYFDEIYNRLQFLHTVKDGNVDTAWVYLKEDEYGAMSRELSVLLTSSTLHAKLALIYGEGELLGEFNALRSRLINIASKLRTTKLSDWPEESVNIRGEFQGKIDPMRAQIERNLRLGASLGAKITEGLQPIKGVLPSWVRRKAGRLGSE